MTINNFTHKTNFRLDIPDGGLTKSFQLNVQETSLPGMIMSTVNLNLNKQMKSTIAGTGVQFDPLSVRIILDEEMKSYAEVLQWMTSTTDFKTNKSTHPSKLPKMALVHVISNDKRDIMCTFRYHEPFPISMGPVDYSFAEDGNMAIQMDVQIGYKYFDLEIGGKIISAMPNGNERIGLHPSMR